MEYKSYNRKVISRVNAFSFDLGKVCPFTPDSRACECGDSSKKDSGDDNSEFHIWPIKKEVYCVVIVVIDLGQV